MEKIITKVIFAVLSSLVKKLTENFLDGRRDKVSVRDLQDQVIRLVASHSQMQTEVTRIRMTVIALIKYLALTQGEVFILHDDDLLELAVLASDQRMEMIGYAIGNFDTLVKARLNQRRSLRSPKEQASNSPTVASEALNKFLDGFEEEIMRARLGREGTSD
ncbi:MAG: hypothetical protein JO281_23045 [Pseudonocardiales bacterium]|nr:hypothetical protein [Pseudonocardiales bacterium]MBV9164352.1 hypothetical protein [Pseudonocardiales bacterium]